MRHGLHTKLFATLLASTVFLVGGVVYAEPPAAAVPAAETAAALQGDAAKAPAAGDAATAPKGDTPATPPAGSEPPTPAPGATPPTTPEPTKTGEDLVADTAVASQQNQQYNVSTSDQDLTGGDKLYDHLSCGLTSLDECLPVILYQIPYRLSAYVLFLSGTVFDYALYLSIDSQTVSPPADGGHQFVNDAWETVRDLGNMAFIFILLYTGIMTIFGMAEPKEVVIKVVIIALLVNFSLFFTKVVIDAGNVLAVGIYSSIGPAPSAANKVAGHDLTRRDISVHLVRAFQPQQFISKIDPAKTGSFDATIIFIIASVVSLAVAWYLFVVAFVFFGRLIAFWVLMILSPLAFVAIAFPKIGEEMFHKWLDNLLHQAFLAPVFLFFLYLIMLAVQSGLAESVVGGGGPDGSSFAYRLIAPVSVAILLVVAIKHAADYAKHMAGTFGEMGSAIVGGAMGVAMGGAGIVGRRALGYGATKLLKNEGIQKMATSDNRMARFIGQTTIQGATATKKGSLDVRSSFVGKALKSAGVDVGEAGGKGGYEAERKAYVEKQQKKAEMFMMTKDQAEAAEGIPDLDKKVRQHTEDLDTQQQATRAAENAVEAAAAASQNSATGQAVTTATDALTKAKEDYAKQSKELEEAMKALEVAEKTGTGVSAARTRVQQANQEKAISEQIVESRKTNLEAAQASHDSTDEGKKLKDANDKLAAERKKLEQSEKKAKSASDDLTEARKRATKRLEEENARRGGIVAKDLTSTSFFLNQDERNAAINAIKKPKKEDPAEKALKEMIKKQMKENEGHSGGGGSSSGGGGGSHH